jgi:hypothetical protein
MQDADGKRRSLAPQVAAGIIAVVAVAALLSYVLPNGPANAVRTGGHRSSGRSHTASLHVRSGVSCDALQKSQEALQSDDVSALRSSLHKAVELAVASLKEDDLSFGTPERLALKLSSERVVAPLTASQKTRISSKLTIALAGCPASQS